MVPSSSKLSKIVQNGQINQKGLKIVQFVAKFSKKVEMVISGLIWTNMVQKDKKGPKMSNMVKNKLMLIGST